ncbi:phosphopantetheine-binding protein [Kocuria sp.]|uniref:phosphopantetheine-binding protein n=1 Tax=Kocuria sp. TaxID=1871328 RepID=UPI0026E0C5C9|nr:phosphopantetheine-binding protein [Kocuria sp.]MDO5618427.1 phosphopantetheine-binding protein [Kocuria sp.]
MPEILEKLQRDVADALGVTPTEVDTHADLMELGLDSVRIMGLVEQILAAGHDVDYADLASNPRLASWAHLLD